MHIEREKKILGTISDENDQMIPLSEGRDNNLIAPFVAWNSALQLDRECRIAEAAESFARAASIFFEFGNKPPPLGRAFYEYSTLMDAFSRVELARVIRADSLDYDASLAKLTEASEILRATIHFGFMSPYIAACMTLEVAGEIGDQQQRQVEDRFQAYKNAIALLEQSKLALSLRDDRHPMMKRIDALLKLSIEGALSVESTVLSLQGMEAESQKKREQAGVVHGEFVELFSEGSIGPQQGNAVDYFPLDDPQRAILGAFIATCPDAELMWLLNAGSNTALIETLGERRVSRKIEPGKSISISMKEMPRGKIRITYRDLLTGAHYDEGCLFII